MDIALEEWRHAVVLGSSTRMYPEGDDIITLADVRFAILVETLADKKFSIDLANSPHLNYIYYMPPTVAQIEREWGRYARLMKERQWEKEDNRLKGIVKPFSSGRFQVVDEQF